MPNPFFLLGFCPPNLFQVFQWTELKDKGQKEERKETGALVNELGIETKNTRTQRASSYVASDEEKVHFRSRR